MEIAEEINNAPPRKFEEYFTLDLEPGLIMEFGVAQGHTINNIARLLPEKTIYGFDSFEGLPEKWNGLDIGYFKGNPDEIEWEPNVELVKGWFKDTLPPFLEEHKEKISIIHIDCDLYSSTKTVLDNLKDRFQDGSIILFDELIAYDGWEHHEYKAFVEFITENQYSWDCIGKHGRHQFGFRIFINTKNKGGNNGY